MLHIENVNHIGIRIRDKSRSVSFYEQLGFQFMTDTGFDEGHPVVMRHPGGVVLNLLGAPQISGDCNILMDLPEKYTGITHIALTVSSLSEARQFMKDRNIAITGSFEIPHMQAIFIRDPDGNVIELDDFVDNDTTGTGGFDQHL